jgi:hypothetical protein
MTSRLGIAFLAAFALATIIAAGCTHSSSPTPVPSPTSSASTSPDTIYVASSTTLKGIRGYHGASTANGAILPFEEMPDNDTANGDVVYDPASDTLWYPEAYPRQSPGANLNTPIEVWTAASTDNTKGPNFTVPFENGYGAATYDSNHNLLYVSNVDGPQVSVYANATSMNNSSVPASTITLNMTDLGPATPRPQEFLYDKVNDRLFVSDALTEVAEFDNFGAAAAAAVVGSTNPTIAPNRYIQGLVSPDGMAYAEAADTLFVGEQGTDNDIIIIGSASTINGPVGHEPKLTTFPNPPGGLAYDPIRDLLFIYDTTPIFVVPHPITATGAILSVPGLHTIEDDSPTSNDGFGIALDTTH